MEQKNWYTLSEVSELTGRSRESLKSKAKRGTLPSEKVDGVRYVHTDEVSKLLAEGLNEAVALERAAEGVVKNRIVEEAKARLAGEKESEEDKLRRALVDSEAQRRDQSRLLAQYNERARLEDRLEAQIVEALANNPYTPRLNAPMPFDASESEHEMLLLVSDAHYPEVVNPEEALGIEYGPEVVRKRMEHITERTKRLYDLHAANYPVGKLTIAVLGDMLSGNIHEELEVTNAIPMADALTDMSYMLFDMGRILSESVPVQMIVMPGNHPRMTKKPRNKQKWDNFEYIMGRMVEALASDYFEVAVPKDIVYTHDIFDQKIGFTHGDGSKAASFAGIPFYGLKQRSNATQAMRSNLGLERLDMLCMGHFHQHLIWTEGDCHIVLNGAIKGGDEYSIVTRSSATDPVQVLLTFHKDRGHINTERIPLGNVV